MAEISRLLLTLACLACVSLAVDVIQTPRLILPAPGEKVHLKCVHNVSGFPVKLWYRQVKPGQPIILIGHNYREQLNMESNFEGKNFQINYKTEMESVLEVSNVSIQDNAVYYCASSIHSETAREQHCTEPGPPRSPPLLYRDIQYSIEPVIINKPQGFLIDEMECAHKKIPLPDI